MINNRAITEGNLLIMRVDVVLIDLLQTLFIYFFETDFVNMISRRDHQGQRLQEGTL